MENAMKCIARNGDGKYLTPRRNTGSQYEDRAGWSDFLEHAKIFQSRAAASNSAKQAGGVGVRIMAIEFTVIGEL
jgi:hypothetical protein